MCAPKQEMNERLNLGSSDLNLRAEQVSEQVALYVARESSREIGHSGRNIEMREIAAVALEIGFNAKILAEVVDEATASTVQAVSTGVGTTWGVTRVAVIEARLS